MADTYLIKLTYIISGLEQTYGLLREVEAETLASLEITDIIDELNSDLAKLNKEDLYKVNGNAGRYVVLLSYVSERLDFFSKKKLDYSNYNQMHRVAQILLNFTKKDNIDRNAKKELNVLVQVLSFVDRKFVQYHFALGYRYLRIFIIMIMYGSYFNASIIARFIIKQLTIGGMK